MQMRRNIQNCYWNVLEHYCQSANVNIIVGDFNCPNVDWSNLSYSHDIISKLLLEFAVDFGFCQCVDFPTRGDNILDIILSDDYQLISSVSAYPPIGSSDHVQVHFNMSLNLGVDTCADQSHQLNWSKADFNAMEMYLCNVDWELLIMFNPNALSAWSAFESVINTVIELCMYLSVNQVQ